MKNSKRIFLLTIAAVLAASSTSCSLYNFFNGIDESDLKAVSASYGNDLDPAFHQLIADSNYKTIDENDGIVFETLLSEDDGNAGLYDENGTFVSELYDDGTNGDRIAGDGIYTCTFKPDVQNETSQNYTVKTDTFESEPVEIHYFDLLKDEDFIKADEVNAAFEKAVSDFKDQNGYIKPDKAGEAIDKAEALAKELYENGDAVYYEVNKRYNNVLVKLSSGITCVYENALEGVEGADAPEKEEVSISVNTFQPCNDSLPTTVPDDAAKVVAGEFDNISFVSDLDNEGVTTDIVKAFSSDQIVIWNGHGGYTGSLHSFVVLGETDASKYTSSDFIEDRLIECSSGNLAFTYRFINEYCGDMENTLIYLGCCEGAHDSVLASSFLNKNCNVVIGFSDSVLANYDRNIINGFFDNLANQKKFLWIGLGYRTVYEAMDEAKKKYGKQSEFDDSEGFTHIAAPIIFGNVMYKLSDLVNDDLSYEPLVTYSDSSGVLQLDKSYISVKKGTAVGVSIRKYPDGYDASDFIWTIENNSIASNSDGVITGIQSGTTRLTVESSDGKYSVQCAVHVD